MKKKTTKKRTSKRKPNPSIWEKITGRRKLQPERITFGVQGGVVQLEGKEAGDFLLDLRAILSNESIKVEFQPEDSKKTYILNRGDTPDEVERRKKIKARRERSDIERQASRRRFFES